VLILTEEQLVLIYDHKSENHLIGRMHPCCTGTDVVCVTNREELLTHRPYPCLISDSTLNIVCSRVSKVQKAGVQIQVDGKVPSDGNAFLLRSQKNTATFAGYSNNMLILSITLIIFSMTTTSCYSLVEYYDL
jgi:hypothetical protein